MNKLLKLVKLIGGSINHTFNSEEDYQKLSVYVKNKSGFTVEALSVKFNCSYDIGRATEEFTEQLDRLIHDGKYHDDRFIVAVLSGEFCGWDTDPNPSEEDIKKMYNILRDNNAHAPE